MDPTAAGTKDYKLQNLLNEIEEKIVCLEDERDGVAILIQKKSIGHI